MSAAWPSSARNEARLPRPLSLVLTIYVSSSFNCWEEAHVSEESPWCAVAVRGSGAAGRDGGSWPDSVRCLGRRCSLARSGNKTLSTTRPPASSVSVSSPRRSSGPWGPSPTETNPRAWPGNVGAHAGRAWTLSPTPRGTAWQRVGSREGTDTLSRPVPHPVSPPPPGPCLPPDPGVAAGPWHRPPEAKTCPAAAPVPHARPPTKGRSGAGGCLSRCLPPPPLLWSCQAPAVPRPWGQSPLPPHSVRTFCQESKRFL